MAKNSDGNNMSSEEVAKWPVVASRAVIRKTDADSEGAGFVGNPMDGGDDSFHPMGVKAKVSKRPKAGSDF